MPPILMPRKLLNNRKKDANQSEQISGKRTLFILMRKLGRWVDEGGDRTEAAVMPPLPPPSSSAHSASALLQHGSSSSYRMPDNLRGRYVDTMMGSEQSPHERASLPPPRPSIPLPSMRPPLPVTPVLRHPVVVRMKQSQLLNLKSIPHLLLGCQNHPQLLFPHQLDYPPVAAAVLIAWHPVHQSGHQPPCLYQVEEWTRRCPFL